MITMLILIEYNQLSQAHSHAVYERNKSQDQKANASEHSSILHLLLMNFIDISLLSSGAIYIYI